MIQGIDSAGKAELFRKSSGKAVEPLVSFCLLYSMESNKIKI